MLTIKLALQEGRYWLWVAQHSFLIYTNHKNPKPNALTYVKLAGLCSSPTFPPPRYQEFLCRSHVCMSLHGTYQHHHPGHPGPNGTLSLLKESFWWSEMSADKPVEHVPPPRASGTSPDSSMAMVTPGGGLYH